jgi:hypothetical protein
MPAGRSAIPPSAAIQEPPGKRQNDRPAQGARSKWRNRYRVPPYAGFLTWLMLSLSSVEGVIRLVSSAAVFVGVASTLAHYVVSCMKRHCRHGTQPLHHRPAH